MKNKAIVVLSTCPDPETARGLAADLVENGLAACVNIVPGIQSVYRWQGDIEQDSEVLIIIKSVERRWQDLHRGIRSAHPYETPEIVGLPVQQVNPDYLDWVEKSCSLK